MASLGPHKCWGDQSHKVRASLEQPPESHMRLPTSGGTLCPPLCRIGLMLKITPKGGIPYRDSFIMLRLNWQDNFKFLIQHRTQKKICSKDFDFELVSILWTNKENPSPLCNGLCWLRKVLSPSWNVDQFSASLRLTAGVAIFWCWEHVLYRKFCRHQ